MAKLIILRGDEFDREVDLGERAVRIGRADQNDIVLPDPAKSVSRSHAELRYEQGKYVVVDLNSQNGVWAAGRRVPQAILEPGVPVVLGSYRLVLKQEVPTVSAPADATLIVSAAAPDPSMAATVLAPLPQADTLAPLTPPDTRLESTSATPPPPPPILEAPQAPPAAEPAAVAKPQPQPAPGKPAPPFSPAAKPAVAAKPAAAPKPAVAARPGTAAKPPVVLKPGVPARQAGRGLTKGWLVGGIGVLLVAALAAAVFLTPLGSRVSELAGGKPAEPDAVAPSQTAPDSGAAATTADRQPVPEATQPAVAPPPGEPPVQASPQPPPATPVPVEKPAAAPARTVRAPVEVSPPAVRTQPAPGGRRGTGAAPAEPKPKQPNLAQMLDESRLAMNKGDYLAAIAGCEAVLAADPNFPDAADLLGVARGGAKNASQLAVEGGHKAEAGGDYAGAGRQFERALQLDPQSAAAPDAMRRLKARMQTDGEDAFKRARQYDAVGRAQDAISMYEKAIQLLPADHASVKTARERLAALKGRP